MTRLKLDSEHRLFCGDCLEIMKKIPSDSIDSIVTDPPYGIGFLGKGWDETVPGDQFAAEALRVLKPGGHLIAFAACRTVHRLAVALEDAGFEIRDQIAWIQWQGFPKSRDISKALDSEAGVERTEKIGKRYKVPDTKKANAHFINSKSGTDFTRPDEREGNHPMIEYSRTKPVTPEAIEWDGWGTQLKPAQEPAILVRKPFEGSVSQNVKKFRTGAINVDGCRMRFGDPAWPGPTDEWEGVDEPQGPSPNRKIDPILSDSMMARVSAPHELGRFPANLYHAPKPHPSQRGEANTHPTVKPVSLMRWLVRLVTPPGGTVLEPFAGSGTTVVAGHVEGFKVISIEREPGYCDIVKSRVLEIDENIEAKRVPSAEVSGDLFGLRD